MYIDKEVWLKYARSTKNIITTIIEKLQNQVQTT